MVNTYAAPVSEQIRILLDLEDEGVRRQPEEIEQSISIAATLYAALVRKNQPTELITGVQFSTEELKKHPGALPHPGGTAFNGNRITEVMRFFTEDFTEMEKISAVQLMETALQKTAGTGAGTIPVLITKNADAALVNQLARMLQRRGKRTGAGPEKILVVVPCRDRAEYEKKQLPAAAGGVSVLPALAVRT